MTPLGTLAWLERYGAQLVLQEIPPSRRQKNRVLLQFRDPLGGMQSVGGRNIEHAVQRAQLRNRPLSEQVTPPNKLRAQSLINRCRRLHRDVRVADIVAVAGVDESLFFKWMRGDYVSKRTAARCENTVTLEPEEFLKRLEESANKKLLEAHLSSRSSGTGSGHSCQVDVEMSAQTTNVDTP